MKTFTHLSKKFNCYKQKNIFLKNFSYFLNTNIKNFNDEYVEMRSDVKTLPTEKMRQSVLNANFGDDASGEDPTVNKLCDEMSKLFGKEKVMFVPTGTMGNLLSLCLSTTPEAKGSIVIQGSRSHLQKVELGGQLQMGFKPFPIKELDDVNDELNLEKVIQENNKDLDFEDFARYLRIVAFENTHNYSGGKIMNYESINKTISNIKNSSYFTNVRFHLDGSRILNAAAALNIDPRILVAPFDTVNVCLSKGLGAPCGSVVLMNESDYYKAKEIRKNIGGAMRQAGFLAAPALVALEDWKERFQFDHQKAKKLSIGLNKIKGLKVPTPDTNIVNIYLDENIIENKKMIDIVEILERDYKVLVRNFDGNRYIRAVIHYQVSMEGIEHAISSFERTISQIMR